MADDNPPSDDEYDGEEETDQPMHADHPLLERAQQALAKQLTAHKTRIEEQLMERTEDLRVAKNRRESIGVELYGVQQQLARLQMTLEKTHDNYNMINRIREQAQEDLRALRALQEDTSKATIEERRKSMEGAKDEMRLREQELHRVDNDIVKCNQEIQQLEADMLNNLSDQTTVEKSAQKTAQTVQKTRGMVQEHHIQSVQLQNELSKIRVDILNTQAHNNKLKETLGTLDEELKEKGKTIEKYEIEIRRRNDEIEKKTKDVDRLNRQYDKLTANMEDENTGPLEATISNLLREINNKAVEGKDLQRRWVGFQTELVSLINDNNGLAETVQRLKSEHTVLLQKRARLDKQYESHQKEIKELDTSVQHMHTDLQRLNTLIAKHSSLQEVLANDNFNLEMTVVNQLKELETQAVKLENKIDQSTDEKRQTLAELVEAERQIMLWERKIALEKEMQEALDPSIGGDIVDAMKKEIHRMTLRHAELLKQQERLIQEMEKAITRRDFITVKGQVTNKKKQPELTEAGLRKACSELKRSIKETDAEAQRSEGRINDLDQQREKLGENLEDLSVRCKDMQRKEEELRTVLSSTLSEKNKAFQTTTKAQRMVKRFEDYEVGRYKISNDGDRTVILNELGKTHQKTATIRDVVDALIAEEPRLEHNLEKVLTLSMSLAAGVVTGEVGAWAQTEKFQMELDKLNSTLKQIEAYNEQMKNEIAVTRRATYVAEESVSKMEKEKKEQDYLIDTLQEQLKQLHQQHQLYEAQLVAQQRETRAAQETLGEAEQEMEAINFEKKQLVQQWKSSLIGMARRDEALQATEEALRKQREQELAIEGEIEGYKRSIKQEQGTNEMLTGVLKKVEGEAEGMQKNITTLREKREKLQDTYIKLKRSLEQTEE
eukprot:gene19643-23495_t